MKKSILIAVLVVMLMGMELPAEKISVGLFGGFNISNLKVPQNNPFGVEPKEFKQQHCYGFGGVVEVPVASFLSFRVQPMYLKRCSVREIGMNVTYQYTTTYVELPVLIKGTIGDTVKPYVLAGASMGFNLGGEVEMADSGVSGTGDLQSILKKTNLSLVVGAGINHDLGKITVFAEGLYIIGLTKINKGGTIDMDLGGFFVPLEVDPLEVRTRDFLLSAGIQIRLGNRDN